MSVRHSYSEETARIIRQLAKETDLTQLQKKGLFLHLLDKNKSFKYGQNENGTNQEHSQNRKKPKTKMNMVGCLRKQTDIVQSGCYERDNFVPCKGKEISERDKESFIFKLAYGCPRPDTPDMKDVYQHSKPVKKSKSRKEELHDEISDRLKFLEEMKTVSSKQYDKSYVPVVKQEIALKLKELEDLEKSSFGKLL